MIIGITGLMGSGKSTVMKYLVEQHGFVNLKFSQGLKDMLRALGCSEQEIEGVKKELPCDLLNGRTPRFAMQTLGTEWGRAHMGRDFWVNLLVQRAWNNDGEDIVIDDVRFPNEAVAIQRDLQGKVWRLIRGNAVQGHPSESEQAMITPDHTIHNEASLLNLYCQVDTLVAER